MTGTCKTLAIPRNICKKPDRRRFMTRSRLSFPSGNGRRGRQDARLLQQHQWASEYIFQSGSANCVSDSGNNDAFVTVKLVWNLRRVRRRIEWHGDVSNTMVKDSIVFLSSNEGGSAAFEDKFDW